MFLFQFLQEVVTKCVTVTWEKVFPSFKKAYFIALIDTLDIRNNSVGLLIEVHHSKDDFSHKLTSSRFTHVYYKREKKCAFFASNIIVAISSCPRRASLQPTMVYLHRMLIVLFMLHAVATFPSFFQWLCLSFSGGSIHPPRVEMILIVEREYSEPASFHAISRTHSTAQVRFKHFVPCFKRL